MFCARTGYCSSVCKEGTVSVSPWLSFASRTQSSLALLGSMCSHQSIGTHNSAITASYGFGVEDCLYSMVLSASYLQFNEVRTISQYYALTDQLNMGVRHLELDIHYFHGQFRMSHCGFSIGIVNYLFHFMENVLKWLNFKYDTDTIGCLPSFNGIPAEDQLLLRPVLEEIRQWMELPRNRDEILILYLDTSVNLIRWKKVEELVSIFQSVFGSLIIPPQPDLDFRRLLVQKKRLMIVSRRVYPGADSVFFSMDSAFTCQYPLFLVESSFTHLERAGHRKGLSQRRNGSERQSLVGRKIAAACLLLARGDEPTALRPAEQGLSPLSVAREHLRQKHARFVRARFQYAGCGLHRRGVGRQPHLDMVARPRSGGDSRPAE
ncbi:hypothetical protein WA538_004680 [Blastocystis sp. DL]